LWPGKFIDEYLEKEITAGFQSSLLKRDDRRNCSAG
jgi:hypothetical protein